MARFGTLSALLSNVTLSLHDGTHWHVRDTASLIFVAGVGDMCRAQWSRCPVAGASQFVALVTSQGDSVRIP